MAKNDERRSGFVARWFRRIWWLRRVVVLGAIVGGVIQAVKGRGGSGAVGSGGSGGGPGGSGRPAPIGGPSAPARSASATPESSEDQTVDASSTRTLVAVPPLVDDSSGDDDSEASAPLLSVVSDESETAVDADRTWVEPLEGGDCPSGFPVKANDKSGIFHVPEGRSYKRTVANRCYPSAEAAEADGYRAAKA